MTAQICRVSMIAADGDYTGCCIFVHINGGEGDGMFATPSRNNADELCKRINEFDCVVSERDKLREKLARVSKRAKKLALKVKQNEELWK